MGVPEVAVGCCCACCDSKRYVSTSAVMPLIWRWETWMSLFRPWRTVLVFIASMRSRGSLALTTMQVTAMFGWTWAPGASGSKKASALASMVWMRLALTCQPSGMTAE